MRLDAIANWAPRPVHLSLGVFVLMRRSGAGGDA